MLSYDINTTKVVLEGQTDGQGVQKVPNSALVSHYQFALKAEMEERLAETNSALGALPWYRLFQDVNGWPVSQAVP